jgi:NAD(P)-dependent dehydrogenase (short-subunit alcohol dehydrogenase family)
VVTTSSIGNIAGRVDLDDLDWERRRWLNGLPAYTTSKLENVLFTRELARRLAGTGVSAACFHPGNIASDFGREGLLYGIVYRTPLRHLVLITPEQGGANLTALCVRPDIADFHGAYFDQMKPHGRTSRRAGDEALARGLWERSAAMTDITAGR